MPIEFFDHEALHPDSLLHNLIWERKAEEPVLPLGEILTTTCCICLQEAFRQCFTEHPEWFTPKTHRVAGPYRDHVATYVYNKAEARTCLVVTTSISYDDSGDDSRQSGICLKHLKEVVERMEKSD